jgi:hypothetical protein
MVLFEKIVLVIILIDLLPKIFIFSSVIPNLAFSMPTIAHLTVNNSA